MTLPRVETGAHRLSTTSKTGDDSFPLIEIGQYTVTVESPGFKTKIKTGIRVDFTLPVGQVMDKPSISELPMNGRNLA